MVNTCLTLILLHGWQNHNQNEFILVNVFARVTEKARDSDSASGTFM